MKKLLLKLVKLTVQKCQDVAEYIFVITITIKLVQYRAMGDQGTFGDIWDTYCRNNFVSGTFVHFAFSLSQIGERESRWLYFWRIWIRAIYPQSGRSINLNQHSNFTLYCTNPSTLKCKYCKRLNLWGFVTEITLSWLTNLTKFKLVKLSGSVCHCGHIESFSDESCGVWGCLAFCNERVLSPNDLNTLSLSATVQCSTDELEFNSDSGPKAWAQITNLDQNMDVKDQFMKQIPFLELISWVCNNDGMLVYCLYRFCAEIFENNGEATKAPTLLFKISFPTFMFHIFKNILDIQKRLAWWYKTNVQLVWNGLFFFVV